MATQKPNVKPDFSLDTIEREGGADHPFTFAIGDRVIEMIDPAELDWKILAAIEQPQDFLRHCFTPADRDFLNGEKIPGWKFNKLMDAYMGHYGIDLSPGNGGGFKL